MTLTPEQRDELEQALEMARQMRPDQLPPPAPMWGSFSPERIAQLIDEDSGSA